MKSFSILAIAAFIGSSVAAAVPAESAFQITKVNLSAERIAEIESELFSNSTGLEERQGGCYWRAFTGGSCDGDAGRGITSSGECIDTRNRHSYFISTGCRYRTTFSQPRNCEDYDSRDQGQGCYLVNTGLAWSSSRVTRL